MEGCLISPSPSIPEVPPKLMGPQGGFPETWLLTLALLLAPVDVRPARNLAAGRAQPTQHVTGSGLGCRGSALSIICRPRRVFLCPSGCERRCASKEGTLFQPVWRGFVAAFIQEGEKSFGSGGSAGLNKCWTKGPRAVPCLRGSNFCGTFSANMKYF